VFSAWLNSVNMVVVVVVVRGWSHATGGVDVGLADDVSRHQTNINATCCVQPPPHLHNSGAGTSLFAKEILLPDARRKLGLGSLPGGMFP
jgi:hypothetical protein